MDQPLESGPLLQLLDPIPSSNPDHRYVNVGRKCAQDLLVVANATEEDGWTFVSNSKGVFIMKKISNKGDPRINCVKGTITINTPPDFVLRVLMDPVHESALDDMLKDTRVIKEVTPTIDLLHLTYKAVLLTSARDFAVCNVVGRIDEHTSVHAACSVTDHRIPEVKGCVRGDVMAGGYCIKDVPGNPNAALVTYITQVDLKGSVPAFVVNKIVESQPQCVNQLDKIVMKEYSKLTSDPAGMEQFEKKFPIYSIFPVKEATPIIIITEHSEPTASTLGRTPGPTASTLGRTPGPDNIPCITTVAEVMSSNSYNHNLEDTFTTSQ